MFWNRKKQDKERQELMQGTFDAVLRELKAMKVTGGERLNQLAIDVATLSRCITTMPGDVSNIKASRTIAHRSYVELVGIIEGSIKGSFGARDTQIEDLIADVQGFSKRAKDGGEVFGERILALEMAIAELIKEEAGNYRALDRTVDLFAQQLDKLGEQKLTFAFLELRDKVNALIQQAQEDINIDDVVQHKATNNRYVAIGEVHKGDDDADIFMASDGESDIPLRVGEVRKVLQREVNPNPNGCSDG